VWIELASEHISEIVFRFEAQWKCDIGGVEFKVTLAPIIFCVLRLVKQSDAFANEGDDSEFHRRLQRVREES
jgi:hypothetical protein